MATILKTFPETTRGRPAVYPWESWFDGRIRHLKKGADFHCTPKAFEDLARRTARKRGVQIRLVINAKVGSVILQRKRGKRV